MKREGIMGRRGGLKKRERGVSERARMQKDGEERGKSPLIWLYVLCSRRHLRGGGKICAIFLLPEKNLKENYFFRSKLF